MLVKMSSILDGKDYTLDLPITKNQLYRVGNRFESGELLQDIVSELPIPQREFLKSGITPDEWNKTFNRA